MNVKPQYTGGNSSCNTSSAVSKNVSETSADSINSSIKNMINRYSSKSSNNNSSDYIEDYNAKKPSDFNKPNNFTTSNSYNHENNNHKKSDISSDCDFNMHMKGFEHLAVPVPIDTWIKQANKNMQPSNAPPVYIERGLTIDDTSSVSTERSTESCTSSHSSYYRTSESLPIVQPAPFNDKEKHNDCDPASNTHFNANNVQTNNVQSKNVQPSVPVRNSNNESMKIMAEYQQLLKNNDPSIDPTEIFRQSDLMMNEYSDEIQHSDS